MMQTGILHVERPQALILEVRFGEDELLLAVSVQIFRFLPKYIRETVFDQEQQN